MKMLEDLEEVVLCLETQREMVAAKEIGTARYWSGRVDSLSSDFIRTHHATIRDMAARLEAAERDAARYRFIREQQATIIYKRNNGVWEPIVDTYSSSTRCASLDAAIDAAMQETER